MILRVRYPDAVRSFVVDGVQGDVFAGSVPWRQFRWYRGQQHFPGAYWSATMQQPVGYESRLELAWLLLADWDRSVTQVFSQPFLLEEQVGTRVRRHVPDFVFVGTDASVTVVDVKPSERLAVPSVAAALAWSGALVEQFGWAYRVCAEPDPVLLTNVRFLAGYRRGWQFDAAVVDAVANAMMVPEPFAVAERAASELAGGRRWARGVLLHLLWAGRLRTDMSRLLAGSSVVERVW